MPISRGSLQKEIQQTKPFRSRAQEAALALFRTTDVVRRNISEAIEPAGVTMQQYNVLRILRGAEPDGLNTLTIAERMVERTPGITRMLDRLEKKSWIRRQRGTEDRRCVAVRISAAGLDVLASLDSVVDSADELLIRALTGKELSTLIDMLDRVRAAHAGSRRRGDA